MIAVVVAAVQWSFLRSEDSTQPADDDSKHGWSMQLFAVPAGPTLTPLAFSTLQLIGASAAVPIISFGSGADFRLFVAKCPDVNFAWRFYGRAAIAVAGDYTFCMTSDDGSLLYMDLTPGDDLNLPLLIDNDGLHGGQQLCRTLALTSGTYQTKAFIL